MIGIFLEGEVGPTTAFGILFRRRKLDSPNFGKQWHVVFPRRFYLSVGLILLHQRMGVKETGQRGLCHILGSWRIPMRQWRHRPYASVAA
jgi:hypothetical protein